MPEQVPRKASMSILPAIALATIVVLLSASMLFELGRSITQLLTTHKPITLSTLSLDPSSLALLLRSIAIAALIALIGVIGGIPIARVIGARLTGHRRLLPAILISPIWLPAALVYAAGNLLRAPDTIVGRALITFSTSADNLRWVTIWAGYAIAIIGLALWSAPIAGVLIASGLGHRSNMYDEMIALEPVGIIRRGYLWVRINLRVLVRSWVLISILMLGSAVPMHLAQLETWSIVIWRQLAEQPVSAWGGVWISAWPMLIAATIGAAMLTKDLVRRDSASIIEDRGHRPPRLPRTILVAAIGVWILGALLPGLAMLWTLNDLGSLVQFWRLESGAVRDSGLLALATGIVVLAIALLVAISLGHPSTAIRRFGAWSVFVLCILGLIPGVLVGAAIARSPILGLSAGWSSALLASITRAAFLGAIIGALCAGSETTERRSIRWQLAGGSIGGWVRTLLPSIALPILASGLIGGLYSLYEIEASVMVRPPGMDNLPQQLLSDLHYARLEQLSAAGVNLLGIGLVFSILASLLLTRIGASARIGN
jgi:ABC-type Fe3+ transport system permease subunit